MSGPTRRLTLQQAARRLGVHEQTLRRYIKRGLIRSMVTPAVSKFGRRHRILESDLDKFARRHLVGPERIEAPPIERRRAAREKPGTVHPISQDERKAENLY